MMTKNQIDEREQLEMLAIEQLVPQDHLVRKLDEAIDFTLIYSLVEHLYSNLGRPRIDPVVTFESMNLKKLAIGTSSCLRMIHEDLINQFLI